MTPSDVAGQTASEFFGERIAQYDSLIRRAVPGYEQLTTALVAELPKRASRILELGCGTGNLSLHLATRFPDATCTFVDASEEMIALTQRRLHAEAPGLVANSRFLVARFEELALENRQFDLVVSAIALHHVRDKQPIYDRVHAWLHPDGRFCFADQLRMSDDRAQQRHWEEFLAFWRQPGHCTDQEIVELQAHSESHDHYETLPDQLSFLAAAGFRSIDAPWRQGFWGVLTATA
jgi:ubiquinone/menaquinone biosynthesis C-methylase UbiE